MEGSLFISRDNNHLTVTYARSLREAVTEVLVAQGVLDG